jgi:hypothetical protein
LADISRRHVVLRREGGQYVLEPLGPTKVDGQTITAPTVLAGNHELALGESLRLRFVRPHALSTTARIDVLSHHRLDPQVDSVLLMGESCLLGSKSHSHVRCRDWTSEVILFRKGGGLALRSSTPISLDGLSTDTPVELHPPTRVEGDDFALSIEPV